MITDIKNYPHYKISCKGDVYNKNDIKLKWFYFKKYPKVALYKNSQRKAFLVHRLVALHFVPNPNDYPIVHHLDNNPNNPHYKNLKWVTNQENIQKAYNDGLINKKGTGAKYGNHPNATSVILIHKETNETLEFDSVTRAAEYLGLSFHTRIYQAIKTPTKTIKGFYIKNH